VFDEQVGHHAVNIFAVGEAGAGITADEQAEGAVVGRGGDEMDGGRPIAVGGGTQMIGRRWFKIGQVDVVPPWAAFLIGARP